MSPLKAATQVLYGVGVGVTGRVLCIGPWLVRNCVDFTVCVCAGCVVVAVDPCS